MMKWLSLVLLMICCCFDTQAVVVQQMGDALSYKNVAKYRPYRTNSEAKKQEQKIDLKTAYSKVVYLDRGDSVIVEVTENPCCSWDVKYDPVALTFINKGQSQGVRTFIFKQIASGRSSDVYIDSIEKDSKSVKQTRALYIKCN